MTAPLLDLTDLTVRFPEPGAGLAGWRGRGLRTVLDGVSLRLEAGEVVALLGSNGAGKSTLLRAACGLVSPTAGRVIAASPPALGLADERSFHWRLSLRENLRLFADLQGASRERIDPLLAEVGLGDRADTPVRACSTGMRARLGLARALLRDPAVLLLDEVERGLDPAGRAWLHGLLRARRGRPGAAALVATHDPSSAGCFTRAILLRDGRVACDGEPFDTFARLEAA